MNTTLPYIILTSLLSFYHYTSFGQEEINVVGNIQSIIDGDISPSLTDRTDFDFALLGGSKTNTYTIENTGSSSLTINNITGSGDFSITGALTPSSPIPAGSSATFTVTYTPTTVGLSSGTITIDNSDLDESIYDFALQGTGANTGMSTWDPLMYPPSPCSWTSQDNNGINAPYASWSLAVIDAEAGGINNILSLQPDAYVGSYDYDNVNGNESCSGHQIASTLNVNAAQNGLQILGSTNGCMTFIDLNSGSAVDQWANFTNMDGLTIKNLFLKGWGGAINLTNCSNVLIEDCVIENCDNAVTNAVFLSACTNVTFRRCSFLGNNKASSRAVRADNSGTSGSGILFEDCNFGCNIVDSEGGALFVGPGSFVEVRNTMFSGNQASSAGKGGAVYVAVGGNAVITDCDFIDNTANSVTSADGSGAVYVNGNSNSIQTTVLIDGCNFFGNRATYSLSYGGAVGCVGNSSDPSKCLVTIQNSIFERNGANRGGAFFASYGFVTLNNNFFTDNQNASLTGNNNRGGALYFRSGGGNYTITNNTFLDNLSGNGQVGNNSTGCGACFPTITGNDYNTQTHTNLTNTGGTSGWSLIPASLAGIAPSVDCSSGAYCAFTLSGSCLSNNLSDFICSPLAANSASISGQVWEDANGNGIQESGDNGISNAFVLLYDDNGYLVGQTNADVNGFYLFSNVLPGNYSVVFINPDIPTYPYMSLANAAGSTESTDSDQADETYINSELRGATSSNIILTAGNSVSDVDAGFTNVFLPVELSYFKGEKDKNSSLLLWSTQTEVNNSYFEIQRSSDGIEWESIGRVNAETISNEVKNYSFTDYSPFNGYNYYRLKQYDLDGTNGTSPVVSVLHEFSNSLNVFPNPADDYILIEGEYLNEIKNLRIYTISGLQLSLDYQYNSTNQLRISLENVKPGLYFLSYGDNAERLHVKFIKK